MNKDVIYIDVEDDITAIIGKVKASKQKIIALVPPKRIGVLQSAVNLRLLDRAASQAEKRLVIITGNQALAGLAAAASIPVAKNLQSKPEIAQIPALEVDNGEDVIDGAQLPVGEHAGTAPKSSDELDMDGDIDMQLASVEVEDSTAKSESAPKKKAAMAGKKVPNFNTFRKRIAIITAAAVLLIGTLVWAIVFAPAATVTITARTTSIPVNGVVRLAEATSVQNGTLKAEVRTMERTVEVEFAATGEKDVGEKAKGTVRFTSDSYSALMAGITIAAGTPLTTSSGHTFYTDRAVTLSVSSGPSGTTGVTAAANGTAYNGATGSVNGAPSSVNASLTDATSGGTSKTVPIVTAQDVQTASEKLVAQSTDDVKAELKGRFTDDIRIIEDSFVADRAPAVSSPEVGGETGEDKKAKLTSKVTYRMIGVDTRELEAYLGEALKAQMTDQTIQKAYGTGADDAKLTNFARKDNVSSVRLAATGQIGPIIEESKIKEEVAGKRFGEIQEELTKIEGVSDVKVDFSYFWVSNVPTNLDKITVEFTVENAGS